MPTKQEIATPHTRTHDSNTRGQHGQAKPSTVGTTTRVVTYTPHVPSHKSIRRTWRGGEGAVGSYHMIDLECASSLPTWRQHISDMKIGMKSGIRRDRPPPSSAPLKLDPQRTSRSYRWDLYLSSSLQSPAIHVKDSLRRTLAVRHPTIQYEIKLSLLDTWSSRKYLIT